MLYLAFLGTTGEVLEDSTHSNRVAALARATRLLPLALETTHDKRTLTIRCLQCHEHLSLRAVKNVQAVIGLEYELPKNESKFVTDKSKIIKCSELCKLREDSEKPDFAKSWKMEVKNSRHQLKFHDGIRRSARMSCTAQVREILGYHRDHRDHRDGEAKNTCSKFHQNYAVLNS